MKLGANFYDDAHIQSNQEISLQSTVFSKFGAPKLPEKTVRSYLSVPVPTFP